MTGKRRLRAAPATVSDRPEVVAFSVSLAKATRAPAGSPEAVEAAQEALFHAVTAVRPTLEGQFILTHGDPDDDETLPGKRRGEMLAAVDFLIGAGVFPEILKRIMEGLEGVGLGTPIAEFRRPHGKGRGGVASMTEWRLRGFAVEAADELKRVCACQAEMDSWFETCGTNRWTIETYRQKLATGPSIARPRKSWVLSWGNDYPEDVLRDVIRAIKDGTKPGLR